MGKIIDEWADWSLKRHSEDEIRDKVLSDYNNICFSYVCEKSPMTKQFAEEFAVLSTGKQVGENIIPYLKKSNYDKYFPVLLNLYRMVNGKKYDPVNPYLLDILGFPDQIKKLIESGNKYLDSKNRFLINFNGKSHEEILKEAEELITKYERIREEKQVSVKRNSKALEDFYHISETGKINPKSELYSYIKTAMTDRLDWSHIKFVGGDYRE